MITDIIYNVCILFLMMIPGILLKKCRLISDGFGRGLSNLVLLIAQPALVFLAYLRDFDKEILINCIYILAISVVAHSIFSAVALLLFKKAPVSKGRILKFATVFSNAAFMGIPLIDAVLSDVYPGAVLYASVYNVVFNVFLWSFGVYICTVGKEVENTDSYVYSEIYDFTPDDEPTEKRRALHPILRGLLHPVTLTALLGMVFFILPINRYVPSIITDALGLVKGLVAPLSMTVIGIRLADMKLKGVFGDLYMYLFLLLRHIALPLLIIGLIKLVSIIGIDIHPAVVSVVAIIASAPAATTVGMFAEKFDCDSVYASRIVTVSTLFAVVSMPLVLLLI